jgi:hypothetical protein
MELHAIKQTIKVPKNHKILIDIPENIPTDQLGEIILIIRDNKCSGKETDLNQAMKDPLFLDDLRNVTEDYKELDSISW